MSVPTSEQTPLDDDAREERTGRIVLEVPVCVRSSDGSHAGITKNICAGGVFVAMTQWLPVGDRVTVTLTIPGDREPVETLAEVRWARPIPDLDNRPAGLGLRFIDAPLRAAKLVTELHRSSRPHRL